MPPRNRRKKRRTEDFSSDSDSSSEDESPKIVPSSPAAPEALPSPMEEVSVDVAIESIPEESTNQKLLQLDNVPLTKTSLNSANSTTPFGNNDAASATIAADRSELQQNYLKLFASEFADDIDQLRQKPDFTNKSLVLLAKALQSGANMFDDQTLLALLDKKE